MAQLIETPSRVEAVPELRIEVSHPRHILRRVILILVVVSALVLAAGVFARSTLNDSDTPELTSLVGARDAPRLLAVFAEPGDELVAAGALAQLDEQGVRTAVVYLTNGDPGDTSAAVARDDVAAALGLDQVDALGLDPGTIADQDPATVGKRVAEIISAFQPSTVLTLPEASGPNAREAHAVTGSIALAAITQSAAGGSSPVSKVWTATLPRQRIGSVLPMPGAFSQYAAENEDVLPDPSAAVPIAGFAEQIYAAASAYDASLMDRSQPWLGKVPSVLAPDVYYRILDREYFHEASGATPAPAPTPTG